MNNKVGYRGSSNSTDFGTKGNRTIQKTVLIEVCLVLKTKNGENYFQSPLFWKNSNFSAIKVLLYYFAGISY